MRSPRAREEIDDLVSRGWRIREETPDRVELFKPDYGSLLGHVVVFVLTFRWTLGLGNLAYAAWHYVEGSNRQIVWNEDVSVCPECGAENPPSAAYCMECGTALQAEERTTV